MSSKREMTIWLAIMTIMVMVVEGQRRDYKVICYYADWSVYYNTSYKFTPKDIDPQLCTHLIYAFAKFANDSISLEPFDNDQAIINNGYKEFTGRKMFNPDLKTMISIGGFNEGSMRFSNIASDEIQRKLFAKNIIKFLRQYNFDGLDIDWQYPAFRDFSKPQDRENYVALVKTISEEFVQESLITGFSVLLLSITAPQKIGLALRGFDMENLHRYIDWINVVGYNYHTAYESKVNHHAPLYNIGSESENDNLNLNYTVNYYLGAGADPQKLVLGIPTFGNTYTLTDPSLTVMGSLSEKPGNGGSATRNNGYLSYFEICDLFSHKTESFMKIAADENEYVDDDGDWKVVEQLPNAGPYAFKEDQWVCYDDVKIVEKKAEYVVENSLGGIMFWAIDNDDYLGNCHGEAFPIIKAAKRALYKNVGTSNINNNDAAISTSNVQESSSTSTTPDPYTVQVEVVTSTLAQPVTINTPGIISDTNTINMTLKPNDLITTPFFVSSMEKMTPFMAVSSPQATSSTCTNRGKSNSNTGLGIHKSNNNDDSVTSINTNSGKPIIDLVMKYVTSKNFQQPQTTEFPLNTKDFTFNPSKSNKGFIYINNVYISNLNLKINK